MEENGEFEVPWKPRQDLPLRLDGTPEALDAAIDAANVEGAKRYQPANGATYCNIFLTDVLRSLGVSAPCHWMHAETGRPMSLGDSGAREMSANAIHLWMDAHGPEYGWQSCSEVEGIVRAARGGVVVVTQPSVGHGHVGILRSSGAVTQAGRLNGTFRIEAAFRAPRFWCHTRKAVT